jgi:5,10-methylene-tetrahydrofolate dehydrogenase/methenyl tetrahydrofolate cyclohydrolase
MSEVLFDCEALAKAMDEGLREAVIAIEKEWSVRLKIVDVAYTDHGFDDWFEKYVDEWRTYIQGIGISYEIEKPSKTWGEGLTDRLTLLSRSPAVHGIRIKGWNLHRGEENDLLYHYLEPRKDIDCRTNTHAYEHLQGYAGRMVKPQIAAVLKILSKTLVGGYSNKTIAIVSADDNSYKASLIHPLAAILRNRRATIISCSPSSPDATKLIRSADAVITSVGKPRYLNRDYVREGQTIIDLQGWGEQGGDTDLPDIEHLVSCVANHIGLFSIERRQPFVNMIESFLLGRSNKALEISRLLRSHEPMASTPR